MDISGLGASSPNAFSGLGGSGSLPPSVQSKLFNQTQSLSLLPPVSTAGLGGSLDIYAAVGMQNMGALSGGRSAMELADISLGIDPSQGTSASRAGATTDADEDTTAGATQGTSGTANKRAPIGAMLDKLLEESGFKPEASNPYEFRKDFFADPTLGGSVDSKG